MDPRMAEPRTFIVIAAHASEFPQPITFEAGAPLAVGERYTGPEGWDHWYFCETPGQPGGWVPVQVIEFVEGGGARARDAYTARELDVQPGQSITVHRVLNGWAWCERADPPGSGWVPLASIAPGDAPQAGRSG